MLLDRDNPLEDDEMQHESIQSPFKSNLCSKFYDFFLLFLGVLSKFKGFNISAEGTDIDDDEKELEEKKVSISSGTEKCGEEQTPEEMENNDDEDEEEYVRPEEAEQLFLGTKHHRAVTLNSFQFSIKHSRSEIKIVLEQI